MFVKFNDIRPDSYSLVVVGAGPAGMIIALEYARGNPNQNVLLIDLGGMQSGGKNTLDESITVLNTVNHYAPYECTNKGLGGSSATWGGRCVMYDRGDFHPRPVVGTACTWNTAFFDDCLPYVAAAQRHFESGEGPFDLTETGRGIPPLAQGFYSDLVSDTFVERWSLPTRFGKRYADELKERHNLSVVLGLEARTLDVPDDTGRISWIEFRQVATGKLVTVCGKYIVLATGAQEVTRLLLRNPKVFAKLPEAPPALGRFYQGHVSGKIASVRLSGDPRLTEYGFRREPDGSYQRRRFQFRERVLVEKNLLNTAFWLDNPLYFDPSHRSGAMSFMYLAMLTPWLGRKLAPPTIAHSITKGKVNRVGDHLLNILRGFPGAITTPASIFYRRYLRRRKLPGVFLYSEVNYYALHFHAEQIPDEQNRMELGPDGETLIIHYRVTEADAAGVVKAHEIFDQELQACGAGKLEYWFPQNDRISAIQAMSKDGVHQSGTTRISDSPDTGVVDSNLKVWGTTNLYVCSSSVFPTSGQANPTFFLGVCAVRLAAHLSSQYASR